MTELGGCTLNFVFRGTSYDEEGKPVDEGLFIGTAAHCILEDDREQVWSKGSGSPAADATGQRFGEFVYARQLGATPTQKNIDFALIRIDDAREAAVNPALCHFGGPTRIANTWSEGDLVHHFGQGTGVGETVPGRTSVLWSSETSESSAINVMGAAIFGDSGGPLIESDGGALGVIFGTLPPSFYAVSIGMMVELAEERLDMDLDLVTAPLAA
jgi:trypsin-like peptidase